MTSKKLVLSFLAVSILGSSAIHASDTTDKIKASSAIAAGLAAGAAVGKYMPGPLPAKIVAGAATTSIATPWLLAISLMNSYRSTGCWQQKLFENAGRFFYLEHQIATPILALTAGISVGKKLPTNLPTRILAGSAIAAGIIAAGHKTWKDGKHFVWPDYLERYQ